MGPIDATIALLSDRPLSAIQTALKHEAKPYRMMLSTYILLDSHRPSLSSEAAAEAATLDERRTRSAARTYRQLSPEEQSKVLLEIERNEADPLDLTDQLDRA